jgi:hypothetical protein
LGCFEARAGQSLAQVGQIRICDAWANTENLFEICDFRHENSSLDSYIKA